MEFNAVFVDVPIKINTVLCLNPIEKGIFRWACGSEEVKVYSSRIYLDPPVSTELATTGSLHPFVPSRCAITVGALLWLERKHTMAIAVRGGSKLARESIHHYNASSIIDAVDFQGCILLFSWVTFSELQFRAVIRENSCITKTVDASQWHFSGDRVEDLLYDLEQIRAGHDELDDSMQSRAVLHAQEKLTEEQRYWYSIKAPELTTRIAAMQISQNEEYIFAFVPKTTPGQQVPRIAGPMVQDVDMSIHGEHRERRFGTRHLSDGDDLFAMLLLNIS
eukprot:5619153-Karenia_brevis.AAC.1